MKKIFFTALMVLLCYDGIIAQDNFLGFWSNENKTQIIKIYKFNNLYCGDIVYTKEKPLQDIKEKMVVAELKKRNKKVLHQGTYYDYESNKKYEIELMLLDSATIVVLGFQGSTSIKKNWHKVP